MKIVRIKGGIGNQLFQYAFALDVFKTTKETVKLDFSPCYNCSDITCLERLKVFDLVLEESNKNDIKNNCVFFNKYPLSTFKYRVTTFLEKIFNRKYYFEKNRVYKDIDTLKDKKYLDGYWQCWRYPFNVREELLLSMTYKGEISQLTQRAISTVSKQNSVFVGIRKGDFTTTNKARQRYGSFSNDYYLKAMSYISMIVKDPIFYIFSNDIEWCKKNIDFGSFNVVFRNPEDQTSDVEELLIMSNCKHAITINSTFHWWGAFLIQNKDKIVIAPSEWFADGSKIDIVPPDWIKMNRNGDIVK